MLRPIILVASAAAMAVVPAAAEAKHRHHGRSYSTYSSYGPDSGRRANGKRRASPGFAMCSLAASGDSIVNTEICAGTNTSRVSRRGVLTNS